MASLNSSTEMIIRLGCFIGLFVVLAFLETLFPRRRRVLSRRVRWPGNIGISILDQIAIRLLIPLPAIALAAYCTEQQWGLMNQFQALPWLTIPFAVLALDLAIYLQHVLFHMVPVFWRLHRMHHADLEFDVTTGIRFHPLSILLSVLIKLAAVLLIGPPVVAVLIFEVLLNATSMFNHSNVKIHPSVDRMVRFFVVTPDMHRVHHSVDRAETNSNFGFNFPWWDRLFGTYRDQPAAGHEAMTIGLDKFRAERDLRLGRMLIQPFSDEDR